MKRFHSVSAALLLALGIAHAASEGSFTASAACPLYQSMKKQTNPGNLSTAAGGVYAIVERKGDDWLRVEATGSAEPRWVRSSCGSVSWTPSAGSGSSGAGSCHLKSDYDSHVFAISWQPGFCKGHSNKPECQNLSKETFAQANFTLHGLWPNKKSCGIDYDFCGSETADLKDFCQFPTFSIDPSVLSRLDSAMPATKYGSCLERHEWWKHGTCRDTSATAYFQLAMDLLQQIDSSAFVTGYLRANVGKVTTLNAFNAAFDKSFGEGSYRKIAVNCSNGTLTEIQINLPKELGGDMKGLLAQGTNQKKGSCSDAIQIVGVE